MNKKLRELESIVQYVQPLYALPPATHYDREIRSEVEKRRCVEKESPASFARQ